jgi:5'-phosphate synthase pdxT subunit
MLDLLDIPAIAVRTQDELMCCRGLIIPGGESTTMIRLLQRNLLVQALHDFATHHPIFGTCAGLILMAKEVWEDPITPFGWLDVSVERNAYGRQRESFSHPLTLQLPEAPPQTLQSTFIRAPRICRAGPDVDVLMEHDGHPICVQQGQYLAASFHPELDGESRLHEHFASICFP